MSPEKARLMHNAIHGCFLRIHYRLLQDMPVGQGPVPTFKDIEAYRDYLEMIYLFDPEYVMGRFMASSTEKPFTVIEGKVILNFTLDECIATYYKDRDERIAQYKEATSQPHR